jgi:hypothetical protein
MYEIKYHQKDISNSTFLITGGAGFIGSNIVAYLLKYGVGKVRVLDNLSNGYYSNIEKYITLDNFEFIEGDIRNNELLEKCIEGSDYVFHMALTKAMRASRSSWCMSAKLSREALASPPCQSMASSTLRARPSCNRLVLPFTCADMPMPHSGGVRQSRGPAR